jgi:hypothetical protein
MTAEHRTQTSGTILGKTRCCFIEPWIRTGKGPVSVILLSSIPCLEIALAPYFSGFRSIRPHGTTVIRSVYSVSQHKTHNTSSSEIEDFRAVYILLSAFLKVDVNNIFIFSGRIISNKSSKYQSFNTLKCANFYIYSHDSKFHWMLITVNSTPDNVVFKETIGRLHTEGVVCF